MSTTSLPAYNSRFNSIFHADILRATKQKYHPKNDVSEDHCKEIKRVKIIVVSICPPPLLHY